MELTESAEMYLEGILVLSKESERVHAHQLAEFLSVSKPAVSKAVGNLKKLGYLSIGEKGDLVLSEMGLAHAQSMLDRHEAVTSFLISLGVSEEVAEEDACRIEHIISEETFEAIKREMDS
jgi:Mn-dependent DtxR family transcriptional regulator